jgi:hypothetical protein
MLLIGGLLNINAGIQYLFFPQFVLAQTGFDIFANQLFRLFVSGVAVGLGIGYIYTYIFEPENLSLLIFGTCLKYWAFIVSLYCFIAYNLSSVMFVQFGIGNLIIALFFSLYMYARQRRKRKLVIA